MTALYANPESVLTRVRKSLVWNFEQITTENGYTNNIRKVFTEIPAEAEANKYDVAIALLRDKTEIENEDQSEQLWHKLIKYGALVYLKNLADPTLARETMLADLEQRLGTNWMLCGEDGTPTCRIATLDGDLPFGMVMNQPRVGFVFGFSLRFTQSISDPSVGGDL